MLTPKQEKFCIEYAKTGNARQSYIAAGYKHRKDSVVDAAASRLLSTVKVKARLAELAEKVESESIADIQEMQKILTNIIRQNFEEEVIVVEGVGNGMTAANKMKKKPATKDIVNAINTLGKMQGAFIEKVEMDTDMQLNITIDYGEE